MLDLLRRLFVTWRLELRLLCLHWTFPVLHVIWALFLFMFLHGMPDVTAESVLRGELGPLAIGSVSLAALFVGAAAASRSVRTRIADLELSYPTGAEVLVGRWLATVTALMSTLVLPLGLALRVGPWSSFLRAAPGYLLDGAITFAFASAVGWCAVVLLGNRRWVYPLLAAGWIGAASSRFFIDRRGFDWPEMALLDFMRTNPSGYQELWGRLSVGDLPLWFNLFYVTLALGVLALAILWSQRRRRRRLLPVTGGVVLVSLALVVTTGAQYGGLVRSWNGDAAAINLDGRPLALVATDREVVDAWEITADLRDLAKPRFDARLTLRNAGDEPISEVTLTLYRDLVVSESSVPVTRDGDQLELSLPEPLAPGATTEVRLTYGGAFTVRTRLHDTLPEPTYFIQKDGVRLLPAVGWYPLAGMDGLDDLDRFTGRPHAPGAFRLTVQAPAGFGVTSNLPQVGEGVYAAEQATWVYLIASPRLRVEQAGAVTVAAPDALLPRARAFAGRYEESLRQMASFFPVQADGLTFAILDSRWGFVYDTPPVDGQLLVVTNASQMTQFDDPIENDFYHFGRAVFEDLWMLATGIEYDPWMGRVHGPFSLQVFLWAYVQAGGDPDGIAAVIDDHNASWRYAEGLPAILALLDIYREHGEAGIQTIVDRLVTDPGSIQTAESEEDVAAWYKEVAGVS